MNIDILLTQRQKNILKVIINDYINRAEPIGSRTLSKYYFSDLSPATIRNEMAELDEKGLLKQPHISAGRIPSDYGYRVFVNYLMDIVELSVEEKQYLLNFIEKQRKIAADVDIILKHTAKILAHLSNSIALVQSPKFYNNYIKYIQLTPLNFNEIVILIVTSNGNFYHYIMRIPHTIEEEAINILVNYLNDKFKNIPLANIANVLNDLIDRDIYNYIDILKVIIDSLQESLAMDNEEIYLEGTSNIIKEPEFKDTDKAYQLINFCEQKAKINEILKETQTKNDIIVYIGNENLYPQLYSCSLVLSSYFIGNQAIGKLGVLGPTRMNYGKITNIVKTVSTHLSEVLTELFA